jgi:hypothetical protein
MKPKAATKTNKPKVKVRDLKPNRDATGGYCATGEHIKKGTITT